MKLKELLQDLPVEIYKGGRDVFITGLCSHSRYVAPGNLFIAKKGSVDDGAKYIELAQASGAAAILTDLPNPFLEDVVQIITPDIRALEGEIAARFYGNPSHQLYTVGITGTNGKTTISYLVKHIFDSYGIPCGLIGTIENIIGEHRFTSELTTPEVITTQKLLKEMVKQRCQAAVMEVSSIGLDQNRVAKIVYNAAIFTNLSLDHLDYHKTMEAYSAAKALLFQRLDKDAIAIVNLDEPASTTMLKECKARKLTYGLDPTADLYAHSIELRPDSTSFHVTFQKQSLFFSWNLIGRFNIYNALAALGAALDRGVPFEALPSILSLFRCVPGRLEQVENASGLHIYVDYAHTPDALEKTLLSLNEIKKTGKIITVFGCGGDRDRMKRPLMGKVVEKHSDFAVVTSDNPRSEEPIAICQAIATGFTTGKYLLEIDRKSAIEKAISMAEPKDLILIAGKGHETYQIFAHQTLPFDDRKIAQAIANQRANALIT